ncbi:hypothetical protein [Aurantiacibacter sp. MUD61]|uniref:hypothetical protein n=1 Tax=Aurantiacibacter sp. MUD61 TaxID=3009083 RepID=UPI0022F0CC9F|nr:hypothetical protein [Aurantiacibacter sp. MUD61]
MSLLFEAGARPCAADIRALAKGDVPFSISIDPSVDGTADEGWVELLVNGLTFDLTGLAPFPAAEMPCANHYYGLSEGFPQLSLEAITLVPGPHLTAGGIMFPVVRGLAALAADLTDLPRVQGVVWHPAHAVSEPAYFQRGVTSWIEGGPFPGLGLTALITNSDGSMQSDGLALFTGQELHLPADVTGDGAEGAKLALRILNWLVEHGKIEQNVTFTGPSGEPMGVEPVENSGMLRVWRGTR